jgi:predicted MFS family arabinose efflux permease
MLVAGGPTLALLALPAPTLVIAAAELATGFANGLFATVETSLLARKIPNELLSRVDSWDLMGSTALRPLGLAIAGPLTVAIGLRPTLLAAAALTVASMAWPLVYRSVRELSDEPEAPQESTLDVPAPTVV